MQLGNVFTIDGAGLGRSRRRRRTLGGARKKSCRYGVNKKTGACLKHPRKRR